MSIDVLLYFMQCSLIEMVVTMPDVAGEDINEASFAEANVDSSPLISFVGNIL